MEIFTYSYNTKNICKLFNVEGATVLSETYEGKREGEQFIGGMTGHTHSEETKRKMSKSAPKSRPHLHKMGKLVKNGIIVEFNCLSHFCKEHKLSTGHVSELLSGKRNSVKGWKNV